MVNTTNNKMIKPDNPIAFNFLSGMRKDLWHPDKRNTFVDDVVNGKMRSDEHMGEGYVRENSNWLYSTIPGKSISISYLEDRDRFLVFTNNGGVEIGWIKKTEDGGTYQRICADKDFGCEWLEECRYIGAESKTFRNCMETTIYFSAKGTYYRIPIDEMLDNRRAMYKTCEDVQQLLPVCSPIITVTGIESPGASTPSGKYRAAVRLIAADGTESNYFEGSGEASVGSENNLPGEQGNGYVRVNITNMSPSYQKAEIIIITIVNGSRQIEHVDTVYYNSEGITYDYRGKTGRELGVSEAQLRSQKVTWVRGYKQFQFNGRTMLYQLIPEKNFPGMKYASKFTVKGTQQWVPISEAHKHVSFMAGEGYIPCYWLNYFDGTRSEAWPLTNTGGDASDGEAQQGEVDPVPDTDTGSGATQLEDRAQGDQGEATSAFTAAVLELRDRAQYQGIFDQLLTVLNSFSKKLDDSCKCAECAQGDCASETPKVDNLAGKFIEFLGNLIHSEGVDETEDDSYTPVTSTSILEAMKKAIADVIDNSKDKKYKKAEYNVTASSQSISSAEGVLDRRSGHRVIPGGEVPLEIVHSTHKFPESLGCDGKPVYGDLAGQPEIIMRFPDRSKYPLTKGGGGGHVPNRYHVDGDPLSGTFVSFFGMAISGDPQIDPKDLPKKLCEHMPIEFGYALRDDFNTTVRAKGLFVPCFDAVSHGRDIAVAKHGVSSIEFFDVAVNNGDSKRGTASTGGRYVFFSPDTMFQKPPLGDVLEAVQEGEYYGEGWRYGLYEEGLEPSSWTQNRIDQRGARQFIALNKYESKSAKQNVKGIMYVPANTTATAAAGIDRDLANKWRESTVYMQLNGMLSALSHGGASDPHSDLSFRMDGLDHEAPVVSAAGPAGYLRRDIPGQYGSCVNRRYVRSGLYYSSDSTTASGLVGDSYINAFAFHRTGQPSNKQGDKYLNLPESPFNALFRFFNITDSTKAPKPGDEDDPKNEANGYGFKHWDAIGNSTADKDEYFAKTARHLISLVVESNINVYYRITRDPELLQIFWPKLKKFELDSSYPDGLDWTLCYLNRILFGELKRPSRWQKFISILIRVIVAVVAPASWLSIMPQTPGGDDLISFLALTAGLAGGWFTSLSMLARNRVLQEFLEIPELLRDSQNGAVENERIRGFHDNFCEYNPDHSHKDEIMNVVGAPDPFDLCDCDNGHDGNFYCERRGYVTNNKILASRKQNLDFIVDSYRSFEAFSYNNIPANSGRLIKLFSLGADLYAHCTDMIWKMYDRGEDITSQRSLAYGDTFAFVEPVNPYQSVDFGYMGTRNPNAGLVTPFGYIFVDDKAKAIFLFGGYGQVDVLTGEQYGMSNFFRKYILFESMVTNPCISCVDQKVKSGPYYSLGYDPEEEDLLFTKYDKGGTSFTLRFDLNKKQWTSRHQYVPRMYVTDRRYLYAIDDSDLYCFKADPKYGYGNFFGKPYPFILSFPIAVDRLTTFIPQSLQIVTRAQKYENGVWKRQEDEFFKFVHFYNDDQSTGQTAIQPILVDKSDPMDAVVYDPKLIKASHHHRKWNINEFVDRFNKDMVMFERHGVELKSNESAIDRTIGNEPDVTNMEDFYIMCTFVYDGADNIELVAYGGLLNYGVNQP